MPQAVAIRRLLPVEARGARGVPKWNIYIRLKIAFHMPTRIRRTLASSAPLVPKTPPSRLQDGLRRLQDAPRRCQYVPRRHQDGPRRCQDGLRRLKMLLRRPQDAPKAPQEQSCPRGIQEATTGVLEPSWSQPRAAPEAWFSVKLKIQPRSSILDRPPWPNSCSTESSTRKQWFLINSVRKHLFFDPMIIWGPRHRTLMFLDPEKISYITFLKRKT